MKFTTLTALATLAASLALPMVASAQDRGDRNDRGDGNDRKERRNDDRDRRDESRNRGKGGRGNAWGRRRGDDRDDRRNDDRDGRYRNDPYHNGDDRYGDGYGDGGNRRGPDRRQTTKNEWRNIAIASGAVGILGLLRNDRTLTFAGAAGALYSTYRYEQDRKSQNDLDRGRAAYFSRPEFTRDGVRYERRTVERDGERYYQFVRAR